MHRYKYIVFIRVLTINLDIILIINDKCWSRVFKCVMRFRYRLLACPISLYFKRKFSYGILNVWKRLHTLYSTHYFSFSFFFIFFMCLFAFWLTDDLTQKKITGEWMKVYAITSKLEIKLYVENNELVQHFERNRAQEIFFVSSFIYICLISEYNILNWKNRNNFIVWNFFSLIFLSFSVSKIDLSLCLF